MSSDTVKGRPWARLPGETVPAYAAFVQYLELGRSRSVAKALDAAGAKPTNRRHWQRWASKYTWVDRCRAYDSDELMSRVGERTAARELAKQKVYDQVEPMLDELRALSLGRMRAGDQQVVTDRNGKPKTVTVEDGEGGFVEVGLTKELVPPKVRATILEHLLGVAGIMAPRRMEITGADGDELRGELKASVGSLDPVLLAALAALLGVGRPK